MSDKIKLVEVYYSEALKHEINSEDFLINSKQITRRYGSHFGYSPFWTEYHKHYENDNKEGTLRYLEMMKTELLKLDEF